MPSECDDDEIVVNEPLREDGLPGEDELQAAQTQTATPQPSPELAQVAAAIPHILQRLEDLAVQPSADTSAMEDRVSDALNDLSGRMDVMMERIVAWEDQLADLAESAATTAQAPAEPADSEDTVAATEAVFSETTGDPSFSGANDAEQGFEQLVFGAELCQATTLDVSRSQLMDGVMERDPAAVCLAARLMLVQAVGADELPPLLKELGEAYYRWQPKTIDREDALEDALVRYLETRIGAVGLRNSIEVIRPGDRYDATRHVSPDRGVEVAEVRGWAVLRDNGKPLTKASVGLR